MIKRKLLLLALLLLLISAGLVVAQSSTNYTLQRFTMFSGGASDSANYALHSVIGQPDTDVVVSANHKVSAGFLQPGSDFMVYLPVVVK